VSYSEATSTFTSAVAGVVLHGYAPIAAVNARIGDAFYLSVEL